MQEGTTDWMDGGEGQARLCHGPICDHADGPIFPVLDERDDGALKVALRELVLHVGQEYAAVLGSDELVCPRGPLSGGKQGRAENLQCQP